MFHSTRGEKLVSSPEAILNGLADDGGLYVIDKLPNINYKDLLNDNYQVMAAKVLNAFFPEFDIDDIKKEIDEAYSTFDTKNVVEVKDLGNAKILELFHGPTLAFKDLALVVLPRLMKLSKKKLGYEKNITILTATSGDTGGAALNGFRSIDGISIVVLYPNGGVSQVQEAQMLSFEADNAKILALTGNFDDCQTFVKKFFSEHKNLSLSSANSINIARLIPQVVYYFYSYIELVRTNQIKDGDKINFCVPTGNFGNIFAGYYAKALGLPVANLICASNKNDVLTDCFQNGVYNKNRSFYKTNSPSMDILISSNFERFIYYANNESQMRTAQSMKLLNTTGSYDFKNPYDYFYAYKCDEANTLKTIKSVYEDKKYILDPHTACAYNAYMQYEEATKDANPTVVVSTASPYKFPSAVLEAFGIDEADSFKAIDVLNKEFDLPIPAVLNYKKKERTVVELSNAVNYVEEVIKCFK